MDKVLPNHPPDRADLSDLFGPQRNRCCMFAHVLSVLRITCQQTVSVSILGRYTIFMLLSFFTGMSWSYIGDM